ncbi:SPOR domain-containing protein [Hahella sp. NBU794]|uniref:SPOR domain-containing protein n=1 Tax=Hahella sp. NBU794 TaxID=3422590 RepID=UPI003D6EF1E1
MSKKAATKQPEKKISPWVWFINLGLAAAFLYFLFYLNSVPATKLNTGIPSSATAQTSKPNSSANVAKTETKESDEPRFKFYDMLPETEVVAPKVEAYTPKKSNEAIIYMLQTGSFREFDDAEKQRATIGFQGLKAQVEEVKLSSENVWYRVQVGPFSSRSKMNSAMDRLVAINIQPLVKKQKREN